MPLFRHFLRAVALAALACVGGLNAAQAADKPRVMVLTDIENEPDDAMSLVRFLVYANQYDIEGLAATTSTHQRGRVAPQRIRQIVSAYGKVRNNLELHEPGFPSGDTLLARVSEGLPVYGMQGVGEGKDSPASEQLIRAVDRSDPRPLYVPVWGGRYELYTPRKERWFVQEETRPIWTNAQDEVMGVDGKWHTTNHATVWRWRSPMQNNFSARMDWTVKPYAQANHPPVPPTRVLSPGLGTMYIILAVTDHGTPRLTRYKRVIVNVVQ